MKRIYVERWTITMVILVSLALLGSGIGSAQDAGSLFDTGSRYLKEGKFDEAIAALSEAIDLDPDYAEAYNNRGLALYEKKQYAQALKDFKQAITINPNDEKAHNNIALVYYQQGDYSNAENYYDIALSLSGEEKPYHADIYNNLGVIYAAKDMDQKALDAYGKAIRIAESNDLGYTNAFYNRANLLYNQKRYDEAIADYTVAIDFFEKSGDVDLDFSDAYYNRGLCYYNKGQYDAAISDYESILQRKPDSVWAHYSTGLAYFMKKDYEQALSAYRKALDIDRDFADAYLGMALVYQSTGQQEELLSSLKKSCSLGKAEACKALEKFGEQ